MSIQSTTQKPAYGAMEQSKPLKKVPEKKEEKKAQPKTPKVITVYGRAGFAVPIIIASNN